MSGHSTSFLSRWISRVFPHMPDFYSLLNDQCDLVVQAMRIFAEYMESGDEEKGKQVRLMEHVGDELKNRNLYALNEAFATPMDREDIYRAINAIDNILNYAKTTTREMETLELAPDAYTLEMAILLKEGAEALQQGFQHLPENPAAAEEEAQAARKAERNAEKTYRRALATLFHEDAYTRTLDDPEDHAPAKIMHHVIEIFKRREVYRHLSNAADRVAEAGEVLHDIVVKLV